MSYKKAMLIFAVPCILTALGFHFAPISGQWEPFLCHYLPGNLFGLAAGISFGYALSKC